MSLEGERADVMLAELLQESSSTLEISGGAAIHGDVTVQGSKNAMVKLLGAAVALPGDYTFQNFPLILDSLYMLTIAERLGAEVSITPEHLHFNTTDLKNGAISFEETKTTTGAFGMAGALLGRFGDVKIGKPGGDKLGVRAIDQHIAGMRALGANDIVEGEETLRAHLDHAPDGASFDLETPSSGATVNFVLATAASGGKATIRHAPSDIDITSLYSFLRKRGVSITERGNSVMIDASRSQNSKQEISFECPPDRNDAFTWLCFGAFSREGLRIRGVDTYDLRPGIQVLGRLGVTFSHQQDGSLLVKAPLSDSPKQDGVVTGVGKDFHSDWAPLLEVVYATLPGKFRVIETVFPNRTDQLEFLQQMGANITFSAGPKPSGIRLQFKETAGASYIFGIEGPAHLKALNASIGTSVRTCAAMVLAASQAEGTSVMQVSGLYRGYANMQLRLKSVGVETKITNDLTV